MARALDLSWMLIFDKIFGLNGKCRYIYSLLMRKQAICRPTLSHSELPVINHCLLSRSRANRLHFDQQLTFK